ALTCVTLVQVAYLFTIHWTNAGTATVLQTVNLPMVLIYVCVRANRRPTKREVIGVAVAFVGVWLLATGGKPST
ncbi:DMT family transporter, partial [Bifidobacterium animalis]|uniref:EamA family transporter n=1 Tax=Bifidobacterium animalis TaxID=28025 RepID=UPI001D013F02